MSIQPRRPMLAVLQEMLRKPECSGAGETADSADLKCMLRRRITEIEAARRRVQSSKTR